MQGNLVVNRVISCSTRAPSLTPHADKTALTSSLYSGLARSACTHSTVHHHRRASGCLISSDPFTLPPSLCSAHHHSDHTTAASSQLTSSHLPPPPLIAGPIRHLVGPPTSPQIAAALPAGESAGTPSRAGSAPFPPIQA
jgi:hypothetical protein